MYELTIEDTFDSAHCLQGYDGACRNLHGHTYRAVVRFRFAQLGQNGMALDFAHAKDILKNILAKLDHHYINDVPEFQDTPPTAENISKYIFDCLKQQIPDTYSVSIWETPTNCATYFED